MANGEEVARRRVSDLPVKAAPVAGDHVVIEDSQDGRKPKRAATNTLPGAQVQGGVQPGNAPSLNDVIRYDGANPLWGKIGSGAIAPRGLDEADRFADGVISADALAQAVRTALPPQAPADSNAKDYHLEPGAPGTSAPQWAEGTGPAGPEGPKGDKGDPGPAGASAATVLLEGRVVGLPVVNAGTALTTALQAFGPNAPDLDDTTHGVIFVEVDWSILGGSEVGTFDVAADSDDGQAHLSAVAAADAYDAAHIRGVRGPTVRLNGPGGNHQGDATLYTVKDGHNAVGFYLHYEPGADGSSANYGTIQARVSATFLSTDTGSLAASRINEVSALPDEAAVGQWIIFGNRLWRRTEITGGPHSITVTKGDDPDPSDETTGFIRGEYGSIADEDGNDPTFLDGLYWTNEASGGENGPRLVARFVSYTDPDTFDLARWGNANLDASFSDSSDMTWEGAAENRYEYTAAMQQVQFGASDTFRFTLAAGKSITYWRQFQLRGATGPAGADGAKGDKGDKGDRGPPGQGQGSSTFIGNTDTPNAYTQAGDATLINSTNNALIFRELTAADIKSGRFGEDRLPEKLDELMDSFNLVGWQNEGNVAADDVWVGPGRRAAYTASNIVGLAYTQTRDQSPAQVGWHVPIRVPDERVPEVADGTLRLQLDDGLTVLSTAAAPGNWQEITSAGGYTYYQVLAPNIPVGTQLVQENITLALTEDRVKAIARTVGGPFPVMSESAVAELNYNLASDPTRAVAADNPALGNGFLLPGSWTTLWTNTEATKALLAHKFDISVWCAWNPSGGGDRGFVEWRIVRVRGAVTSVEERDNLYIRNMPASGTPIQDANGISRYRYIRVAEDFLYEPGDTLRLEVKAGSQRGTADAVARGSNNYIQFAGDARDTEARNSVITLTKMRG